MFSSIDFQGRSQEVKRKKMKINQIDRSETKQGKVAFLGSFNVNF